MKLHEPLRLRASSRLRGTNPVAVLAAAAILMLALFLAVDAVTGLLVLAALAATVPVLGLPVGGLAARGWPLLGAAAGIGLFTALFAGTSGETLFRVGPLAVTAGGVAAGAAIGLRLVGIASVGVIAVSAIDPTDLADALVQQLRASPRFAIGTLAAFNLVPVFAREWEIIGLARRARGVDAGSPWAAVRLFAGKAFTLLVAAIRRGSRMALAMDARGFGSRECRTSAREQRMRPRDWLLIGVASAVAASATGLSVAIGTWRFVLG